MHHDEAMPEGAGVGIPVPDAEAEARRVKEENTAIALLALHGGHQVHRLADGGFLVAWRAHQRYCANLAELRAHARRVGAVR